MAVAMNLSAWKKKIQTARTETVQNWDVQVAQVYRSYSQLRHNSMDLENRSRHWRQYLRNKPSTENSK